MPDRKAQPQKRCRLIGAFIFGIVVMVATSALPQTSFAEEDGAVTAEIIDVRYGKHANFVRVVIDSKGALSYTKPEDAEFSSLLLGLASFSAVDLQMDESFAPLSRVTLAVNTNGIAELTFVSSTPLANNIFPLNVDGRGLHRLVIDLSSDGFDYQHLSISQEGVNPKRIRVQFADPLTDKK